MAIDMADVNLGPVCRNHLFMRAKTSVLFNNLLLQAQKTTFKCDVIMVPSFNPARLNMIKRCRQENPTFVLAAFLEIQTTFNFCFLIIFRKENKVRKKGEKHRKSWQRAAAAGKKLSFER